MLRPALSSPEIKRRNWWRNSRSRPRRRGDDKCARMRGIAGRQTRYHQGFAARRTLNHLQIAITGVASDVLAAMRTSKFDFAHCDGGDGRLEGSDAATSRGLRG